MNTLALVSGLVGALASAALSFAVRFYLDKRAQREAERRIAYVYFLTVSEFVALEVTIRSFAVAYDLEKAAAKLRPAGSTFDISHAMSAFMAEAIVKKSDQDPKSSLNMRLTIKGVEALLDSAKSTRLSAEQLSKLPKDVVALAMRFQSEQQQVCVAVDSFAELLASQDRTEANASIFQEQWKAVVRFASAAKEGLINSHPVLAPARRI